MWSTYVDEIKPVLTFEIALCDRAYSCTNIGLSTFVGGIVEYIAAWGVQKVTKYVLCKEFSSASECTSAFLIIKNNGRLVVPSVSVIKHCEVVMGSSKNIKKVVSGEWERLLVSRMLIDMPCDLFPELNEHFVETSKGIDIHFLVLAKFICTQYVKLRWFDTIKLTNLYLTCDSVRHKFTKTVLFRHQWSSHWQRALLCLAQVVIQR